VQLAVAVRQYASHTVTVTGLVNHQGVRALKQESVPLYVIISESQPRAEAGRVTIMRTGYDAQALALHDPETLKFKVQAGDVINIAADNQQFYFIGGRISRPGQKLFQPGMTLLQAILAAGGLIDSSDYRVEVMREGADGRLKTTSFDLRYIKSGKVPDPRIQSGDSLEVH
jgi:protein involved in polysaccharide export with SLBB domain